MRLMIFFFFNDTATTEIYTLSLHDALPIFHRPVRHGVRHHHRVPADGGERPGRSRRGVEGRSEEHTSELQSRQYIGCRLLLEEKIGLDQRRWPACGAGRLPLYDPREWGIVY